MFNGETYVFNRVAFGLKTAGGTYNRAMKQKIPEEIKNLLIMYIDDYLVHHKNRKGYLRMLDKLLQALEKAGARINIKKCQ